MNRNTIVSVIAALLVLLFTYAAVTKIMDYNNFQFQIGRSPFIAPFTRVIPWALPGCELILAGLLMANKTRLIGLYASLFIMSVFTAYVYFMTHYSYYVPCSCGGILENMNWTTHFYFNICFVLLSITGIFLYTPPELSFSRIVEIHPLPA